VEAPDFRLPHKARADIVQSQRKLFVRFDVVVSQVAHGGEISAIGRETKFAYPFAFADQAREYNVARLTTERKLRRAVRVRIEPGEIIEVVIRTAYVEPM